MEIKADSIACCTREKEEINVEGMGGRKKRILKAQLNVWIPSKVTSVHCNGLVLFCLWAFLTTNQVYCPRANAKNTNELNARIYKYEEMKVSIDLFVYFNLRGELQLNLCYCLFFFFFKTALPKEISYNTR